MLVIFVLNEELKIILGGNCNKEFRNRDQMQTNSSCIWLVTFLSHYFDFNSILFKKAVMWAGEFLIFLLILWKVFLLN
jgi:hypothetical protein